MKPPLTLDTLTKSATTPLSEQELYDWANMCMSCIQLYQREAPIINACRRMINCIHAFMDGTDTVIRSGVEVRKPFEPSILRELDYNP